MFLNLYKLHTFEYGRLIPQKTELKFKRVKDRGGLTVSGLLFAKYTYGGILSVSYLFFS